MNPPPSQTFTVQVEQAGKTLAALLRHWLPGRSWSKVRELIDARRVKLNGEVWLDDARRLKPGDAVELLARAEMSPQAHIDQIPIRHIDEHIVVVEKPSGISTVRHPAERDWLEERRLLVVTLDDLVMRQIGMRLPEKRHDPRPRLRVVQRLDKETSGLVVFARTVQAERGLGQQFRRHSVTRRYLAIVQGKVANQTIRSMLVRDRGDGRRGSTTLPNVGKQAVTHVAVVEALKGYSLLSCRLETGRTHQIRIHLAELRHPVLGDRVYHSALGDAPVGSGRAKLPKQPAAYETRLALHAAELGFEHPITGEPMHWQMPLPPDLRALLDRLRSETA